MENKSKQLQDLSEIRNLMERSSRFISLSGLSGVFAGLFAIIGAGAAYYKMMGTLNPLDYYDRFPVNLDIDFLFFLVLDAVIVLVLSITCAIYFTSRKAKNKGLPAWDEKAFRMLANLAIPLVAGGVFCLILLYHSVDGRYVNMEMFGLVAPTTLVFYGLGLLNASKFTLDEIRYLGVSEIILGLVGCIFLGYGLVTWVLGFGVLHIVYGAWMYFKYEK